MKFLHLADLHFGKSLYGCSMMTHNDQPEWVNRFLALVEQEQPQAVVIAGDVYDRSTPPSEAVALLNDFMTTLVQQKHIPVLMIAGNHDSGARLSIYSDLLKQQNLHISGILTDTLEHITLEDEYGEVTFWLMPYLFPAQVAYILKDDCIRDYDTAVRRLLAHQQIDFSKRNVLIAHQNVTANGQEVQRGGSESMVGGVGAVDYTAFDGFDYVALGHIHSNYSVGRKTVRYAGSPLCYHFEELRQQKKGPLAVTMGAKGDPISIQTRLIEPLHPMYELKGTLEEMIQSITQRNARGEYVRAVLQGGQLSPYAAETLRTQLQSYDSLLLDFSAELTPFSSNAHCASRQAIQQKSEEALFADFFAEQTDGTLPDEKEWALLSLVGELVRNPSAEDSADIERLIALACEQEA